MAVESLLGCPLACNKELQCVSLNVNTSQDSQGLFQCSLLGFAMYQYGRESALSNEVDHYTLPIEYFSVYQNCAIINKTKSHASGVFGIRPSPSRSVQTYCDLETSGGGWTVIQRRLDGSVDFYRGWDDYKKGFGNKDGEYWLGLDAIHDLTSQGPVRLRVDLEDFEGNTTYAEYSTFTLASEEDGYQLKIGLYSGDAGNSLNYQQNTKFTTKDRDNDHHSTKNCAQLYKGAWWYKSCHVTNLNGMYLNGTNDKYATGVIWHGFRGHYYSLKKSEMKIRPVDYI